MNRTIERRVDQLERESLRTHGPELPPPPDLDDYSDDELIGLVIHGLRGYALSAGVRPPIRLELRTAPQAYHDFWRDVARRAQPLVEQLDAPLALLFQHEAYEALELLDAGQLRVSCQYPGPYPGTVCYYPLTPDAVGSDCQLRYAGIDYQPVVDYVNRTRTFLIWQCAELGGELRTLDEWRAWLVSLIEGDHE